MSLQVISHSSISKCDNFALVLLFLDLLLYVHADLICANNAMGIFRHSEEYAKLCVFADVNIHDSNNKIKRCMFLKFAGSVDL